MKYYLESAGDVISEVRSSESGLSADEAAKRLSENGPNALAKAKKDSVIKQFFSQLTDPMIIILIVAAVISGITSYYSGEGYADVIIILFVVVLNVNNVILPMFKVNRLYILGVGLIPMIIGISVGNAINVFISQKCNSIWPGLFTAVLWGTWTVSSTTALLKYIY